MRNPIRTAAVLLCSVALISACGKSETAQGATRESAAATASLKVTSVDLGRSLNPDKTIRDGTDNFRRTDPIYASIKTEGTGTGTLTARWTYQDGQVVDESSQTISASSSEARTEFHITKPDGWPVGKYRLEVRLNDQVVETEEFEVK